MAMEGAYLLIDHILISLYRVTGSPVLDYFMGTFMLSMLAALMGEAMIGVAYRANRRHIEGLNAALSMEHETSIAALRKGDRETYRLINRQANDTFGRFFFNMIALSAASLAPVFFALSWMQTRFMSVEFQIALPVLGGSVGYVFTFLLMYVSSRMIMGRLKRAGWFRFFSPDFSPGGSH
jgi:hypothetical protein